VDFRCVFIKDSHVCTIAMGEGKEFGVKTCGVQSDLAGVLCQVERTALIACAFGFVDFVYRYLFEV